MRRAHTLRNTMRPSSIAIGADDLGMLREQAEETVEDQLRRQLLASERENDKLKEQVENLRIQLKQRPTIERLQELQKEWDGTEMVLQGTLRENEKLMGDMVKCKERQQELEAALRRVAGNKWQEHLEVAPGTAVPLLRGPGTLVLSNLQHSTATPPSSDSSLHGRTTSASNGAEVIGSQPAISAAAIENTNKLMETVRLLVLGMQDRSRDSELKLRDMMERAAAETNKLDSLRKEIEV